MAHAARSARLLGRQVRRAHDPGNLSDDVDDARFRRRDQGPRADRLHQRSERNGRCCCARHRYGAYSCRPIRRSVGSRDDATGRRSNRGCRRCRRKTPTHTKSCTRRPTACMNAWRIATCRRSRVSCRGRRASQQSARRYGHERRHPRRVQPDEQARGRLARRAARRAWGATSGSAARWRLKQCRRKTLRNRQMLNERDPAARQRLSRRIYARP